MFSSCVGVCVWRGGGGKEGGGGDREGGGEKKRGAIVMIRFSSKRN